MSSKAGILARAAVVLMGGTWLSSAHATVPETPAEADVNQTIVHFGDLNVNNPQGASALYRRIRHAALGVCGDPHLPDSRITSRVWERCVSQSIDRAVAAVDQPALTAYHRLHSDSSDRRAPTILASSARQ